MHWPPVCLLAVGACASDRTTDTSATSTASVASTAVESTTSADASGTTGATTTSSGSTTVPSLGDVTDALKTGDFSLLGQAIAAVGVDKIVDSPTFTLFAPDNAAFSKLSADQLRALLADPSKLGDVLRNHVVKEKLTAADLAGRTSVVTAAGNTLPVTVTGTTIMVGGATVVKADQEVGDGVIHTIDALLLPPS